MRGTSGLLAHVSRLAVLPVTETGNVERELVGAPGGDAWPHGPRECGKHPGGIDEQEVRHAEPNLKGGFGQMVIKLRE